MDREQGQKIFSIARRGLGDATVADNLPATTADAQSALSALLTDTKAFFKAHPLAASIGIFFLFRK